MTNPYSPPGLHAAPEAAYAPPQHGAAVGDGVIEMLRLTRPWVMVISVLCIIGAGLMILAAAGMGLVGMFGGAAAGKGSPLPMALLSLVYVPFAALYVYPGLKLWKYAGAIASVVVTRSMADLESALLQQKSFWKYSGVTAVTVLGLYILAIFGAIVFAVFAAATSSH